MCVPAWLQAQQVQGAAGEAAGGVQLSQLALAGVLRQIREVLAAALDEQQQETGPGAAGAAAPEPPVLLVLLFLTAPPPPPPGGVVGVEPLPPVLAAPLPPFPPPVTAVAPVLDVAVLPLLAPDVILVPPLPPPPPPATVDVNPLPPRLITVPMQDAACAAVTLSPPAEAVALLPPLANKPLVEELGTAFVDLLTHVSLPSADAPFEVPALTAPTLNHIICPGVTEIICFTYAPPAPPLLPPPLPVVAAAPAPPPPQDSIVIDVTPTGTLQEPAPAPTAVPDAGNAVCPQTFPLPKPIKSRTPKSSNNEPECLGSEFLLLSTKLPQISIMDCNISFISFPF
jgi:hypothetical protein